ncbi:MAG: PTS sugar transporter subunit IIAB, partial [Mycoplasma sp.]|nr:PTS sugar transporter subunit IIAB [Mycoplasma sp.]
YYIITEKVAMPHAQNENNNVLENCFSLITLQEPIYFENSDKPISILIGLASINSDIHTSKALPQIMAIFENPQIVNKIEKLQLVEDFFKLIKSIEIDKYIKKDE